MGSEIDGKLTYLGSQILRADTKKISVNELGSLERKVFQNTVVNKKQIFKKIDQHNFGGFLKIWSTYLGSLKNLVKIFGGLTKWPDMITPTIKVNEFPPGIVIFIGQHKECLGKILKKAISHALLHSGSEAYSKESA